MIEGINKIDTELFLYLNGLHHPIMDKVMLTLSYNKWLMGLLIVTLLTLSYKKYKKNVIFVFIFAVISFGLSDSISTKVFKDQIKRLRPCKQEQLASKVHLAGKKCWGGKYGFVSSHAANSFAISMFFFLILARKKWAYALFVYSFLVSYSRVYLAKHFPGDILGGALLGILIGSLGFYLFKKLINRIGVHRSQIN